jgi:serine/threonine-protein kinase
MLFAPPSGTELVKALGVGTLFQVALVRAGDTTLICKRLTPRALLEPAGRAAIVREAKVLALARHPALPSIVRVGSDEHGPFVLETRAEGVSLRDLVEHWAERGEDVPARLIAHIAARATRALDEIQHLQAAADGSPLGIVHGDLGPDHVLLGPFGEARLVDFGAARWAGMDASLAGGDRGTLPYVAPEVARGEAAPSAAADVYALAATLLYVATGQPPCDTHDEPAMLAEIGDRGIAPARVHAATAFTEAQRQVLAAALVLDATARKKSAAALRAAFDG